MKIKRCALSLIFCFLALCGAFAQGADPKTVTPAWVMEKQFEQQKQAGAAAQPADAPAAKPVKPFSLFFIGYDVPTLSGPLADDLAGWSGPVNFSLGMEMGTGQGSSMLTGLGLELFVTLNDKGSRFLMHDMAMIGYTFDLAPIRLNLGARVGLSMIDVMDDTPAANTFTALGLVFGPEASLYFALDPSFWLWARGRYSMATYMSLDSSTTIHSGNDSLNCLSLEAGVAFKM
jgi:hypothetical protein